MIDEWEAPRNKYYIWPDGTIQEVDDYELPHQWKFDDFVEIWANSTEEAEEIYDEIYS